MSMRELFSERRFSGFASWLITFWLLLWFAGAMASLAAVRHDGRIADVTTVVVLWPLFALAGVSIMVIVLKRALGLTVNAVLAGLQAYIIPPVILAFVVLIFVAPSLAFPLALFIAALMSAFVIWRESNNWHRALLSGLVILMSDFVLLIVPTALGLWGLPRGTPDYLLGPVGSARGLILLATNSYWWKNIYERFPFSSGGEAAVGVNLMLGAIAYSALALTVLALCARILRLSWQNAWNYLRIKIFLLPLALWAFGLGLAIIQGAQMSFRFGDLLAWMVAFLTLASAWLFILGRNDLADLGWDELHASDKPLILGLVREQDVREANMLFLVMALIGAWLLGWPIFLNVMAWIAAYEIYHSWPMRFKERGLLKYPLLGLVGMLPIAAGYLFALQSASVHGVSTRFWLGFVLLLAFHAVQRDIRDNSTTSFLRLAAGVSVLGYVVLPLLVGSWKWFLLAAPVAALSAFVILTRPYQRQYFYGLFYLFLLTSLFLMS